MRGAESRARGKTNNDIVTTAMLGAFAVYSAHGGGLEVAVANDEDEGQKNAGAE